MKPSVYSGGVGHSAELKREEQTVVGQETQCAATLLTHLHTNLINLYPERGATRDTMSDRKKKRANERVSALLFLHEQGIEQLGFLPDESSLHVPRYIDSAFPLSFLFFSFPFLDFIAREFEILDRFNDISPLFSLFFFFSFLQQENCNPERNVISTFLLRQTGFSSQFIFLEKKIISRLA